MLEDTNSLDGAHIMYFVPNNILSLHSREERWSICRHFTWMTTFVISILEDFWYLQIGLLRKMQIVEPLQFQV